MYAPSLMVLIGLMNFIYIVPVYRYLNWRQDL